MFVMSVLICCSRETVLLEVVSEAVCILLIHGLGYYNLSLFLPLTGKFESWLGRHSTPTSSPHHLPPSGHDRNTTGELEKQLETLKEQLHTKQTLVEQLQVHVLLRYYHKYGKTYVR